MSGRERNVSSPQNSLTTVALIEPAMILIFGALVGFVALAMLQAIYGINLNAF